MISYVPFLIFPRKSVQNRPETERKFREIRTCENNDIPHSFVHTPYEFIVDLACQLYWDIGHFLSDYEYLCSSLKTLENWILPANTKFVRRDVYIEEGALTQIRVPLNFR